MLHRCRFRAAAGAEAGQLPSFLAGSETLFVRQRTDIAFVDFSQLKSTLADLFALERTPTHRLEGVTTWSIGEAARRGA